MTQNDEKPSIVDWNSHNRINKNTEKTVEEIVKILNKKNNDSIKKPKTKDSTS